MITSNIQYANTNIISMILKKHQLLNEVGLKQKNSVFHPWFKDFKLDVDPLPEPYTTSKWLNSANNTIKWYQSKNLTLYETRLDRRYDLFCQRNKIDAFKIKKLKKLKSEHLTSKVLSPKKWISVKSWRYRKQYVLSQPFGNTCKMQRLR